jgi:hypothetical protein
MFILTPMFFPRKLPRGATMDELGAHVSGGRSKMCAWAHVMEAGPYKD